MTNIRYAPLLLTIVTILMITVLFPGILLLIISMILITAKLKDLNDHLGLRRVRRCSSARGWLFSHWLLLHGTKEGQVDDDDYNDVDVGNHKTIPPGSTREENLWRCLVTRFPSLVSVDSSSSLASSLSTGGLRWVLINM